MFIPVQVHHVLRHHFKGKVAPFGPRVPNQQLPADPHPTLLPTQYHVPNCQHSWRQYSRANVGSQLGPLGIKLPSMSAAAVTPVQEGPGTVLLLGGYPQWVVPDLGTCN